ncbi:MAG: NAD-dependent epimerase/dehydratase family protein [Deltaproteobacteria bacterium]|nr:MAG: NAD-dependent epimerase/dehydratase family protein [Deltaproteobacteria bacterium]
MGKCLLLGGGGFIGSHLAELLLNKGYQVRIFDRPGVGLGNIKHIRGRIELVPGEFARGRDVKKAVKGCDYIFHLIGTTIPESSNRRPKHDVSSNVISTIRMLEIALAEGVKKVIFSSSGGTVYGIARKTPIPEDHPTAPLCSYGITKLTVERYLQLFNHLYGLNYIVLRSSNPYGERQGTGGQQGVVPVLLRRVKEGKPLRIWGDGSVVRDFIYIDDLVRAFLKALTTRTRSRVFNIGTGRGTSINGLIELIRRVTGREFRVEYAPGRKVDVPVNILDPRLAGKELKWKARVSLEEGVRRIWKCELQNAK